MIYIEISVCVNIVQDLVFYTKLSYLINKLSNRKQHVFGL